MDLESIDPSIIQAIAYAGANNFTGAPVPGYTDAVCLLTPETAEAMARAQTRLRQEGLTLVVFDCYRPERAVAAFIAWTQRPRVDGTASARRYAPRIRARDLIAQGYLARRSSHSRGFAVDVGLAPIGVAIDRATRGRCTDGEPGASGLLDMGTQFDCFDPMSGAEARDLTRAQRRNREILRRAMTAEGFRPYRREWWHFSYPPGDPGVAYDVETRRAR